MSKHLQLLRVSVDKDQWESLTEDERIFAIQTTHLMDELSIIDKCFIYSFSGIRAAPDHERTAMRVQALFFIRLLAGKLKEGREVLNKSYFSKAVSAKYDELLSQQAKKALKQITRYFDDGNCLATHLRDTYAFHYDRDSVQNNSCDIGKTEPFIMYIGKAQTNNMFATSSTIIDAAVLRYIEEKYKTDDPMRILMSEIAVDVYGWFAVFIFEMLELIFAKLDLREENIEINNVPNISDVRLPFFVEHG